MDVQSALRWLARRQQRTERTVRGLSRSRQIAYSSLTVGESEIGVADVASQSAQTAQTVESQSAEIAHAQGALDGVAAAADDLTIRLEDDSWSTHDSDMRAIGSLREVHAAQDAVEEAVQTAVAAHETAMGNARYRYNPATGVYDPPLPADGPRQGAQRVHLDTAGKAFQVDVWNGTQWNRDELLLNQVLVLGVDGVVQIENGRVVAPEIIGGDVVGARVRGGLVEQVGEYVQGTSVRMTVPRNIGAWTIGRSLSLQDPSWPVPAPPAAVESTSAMLGKLMPYGGTVWGVTQMRIPTIFPAASALKVSIWVCSRGLAQTVQVEWPDGTKQPRSLASDTWTLLTRDCTSNSGVLTITEPPHSFPTNSSVLLVTDVLFEMTAKVVSGSALEVQNGRPQLAFFTGPSASALTRVGTVSPSGVSLPGVDISDGGVVVRDGGSFASNGNTVLAGKSLQLLSSSTIAISTAYGEMSATYRGTTSQRVALGASGFAEPGMRFRDVDENRDYVWTGTVWAARSGSVAFSTGALTAVGTTGFYGATVTLSNIQTSLLAGEKLRVTALQIGTGWGELAQVSTPTGPLAGPISVNVRFKQGANSTAQTVTAAWEVISG